MKIKRMLKNLMKEEKGAIVVIVAFAMVALIGVTALTVDVGNLYFEKSDMQNTADAAALAGVQYVFNGPERVKETVVSIVRQNGIDIQDPTHQSTVDGVTTYWTPSGSEYELELKVGPNFVEPILTGHKSLTFAKIFGEDIADVVALARAEIGNFNGGAGISPIAVVEGDMNFEGTQNLIVDPEQGNFGFLDLNGQGAQGLYDAIVDGGELAIGDEEVFAVEEQTQTGVMWGKAKGAVKELIKRDEGSLTCNSPDTADSSCNRVIITPIIETLEYANGKSTITIIGFASYYLHGTEDGNPKKITGEFLRRVSPGDLGDLLNPGTTYVSKLVN
jgi:hypothetical protein